MNLAAASLGLVVRIRCILVCGLPHSTLLRYETVLNDLIDILPLADGLLVV